MAADPLPALRLAQSLASIRHAPRQCSPAGGVKFAAGLLFHGQVHERYTLGGNRAPAPIACPVPGQGPARTLSVLVRGFTHPGARARTYEALLPVMWVDR
jgi:hypothetical protein